MNYRYQHAKELTNFSRQNRKNQTEAEKLLWSHLRNKQLLSYKFHRQYPVAKYILDFYCLEKKLAIELDGSQHMQQEKYDGLRSKNLENNGITVLRFWDNEIFENINGVLEVIMNKLQET